MNDRARLPTVDKFPNTCVDFRTRYKRAQSWVIPARAASARDLVFIFRYFATSLFRYYNNLMDCRLPTADC